MKKITQTFFSLFFFCNGCVPLSLFAQAGTAIQWQNTIGGSNGDLLYSAQQTRDGGYILGGHSASNISGDKTENNKGLSDYWIVKVDSIGNIQWQRTIGGSGGDLLRCVQQTNDGGFILGGFSDSNISGDKAENSLGLYDYWIVKTDSLGNILWENTIGGSSSDLLTAVRQTLDGGYILGGQSNSNISGDKSENNWDPSTTSSDYWIVKTDSAGTIEWENTIGGHSYEVLLSIEQTDDGGYILGGDSPSQISGDKTEGPVGGFGGDYWIVKLDGLGTIQWQNAIGGVGASDEFGFLSKTSDGGFILGGSSNADSSGDKTEDSFGNYDYWIVKISANGTIQWDKSYGGDTTDALSSIEQTADSGYIIGGYSFSGISGNKSEGKRGGDYDYWILKTDITGNIQWQNTIGGNNNDGLSGVFQTSDSGYFVYGYSYSNISGDKAENCIGSLGAADYWILKLTDTFNSITGKLFIDLNSNGMQDTAEPALSNTRVIDAFTTTMAFSNQEGNYNLTVLDSGNYLVTPAPISYYAPLPAVHTVYFSGIYQSDSLNDFAYQPVGLFDDLCAQLSPLGIFRAGRNANYMLSYENVGTTTLTGTVIFFPDSNVAFVSSDPIPDSITTDSVVWNVGTLAPFQKGNILLTVHVDQTTPTGTVISSDVRIEPVAGDENTACNYGIWDVVVTGSYDPNEILVDRSNVFTTELPNPPFLEYIINFQNTGNDTAFDVRILNPIDTNRLQLNTIEFVASSHPVNMKYKPWERNMEFTFTNILLPDSTVNEPASHGFVRYRIKPKSTLSAGDTISNTAYIYFDFNAPVQTNTAITEIILPSSVEELTVYGLRFTVYPNPLTNQATVAFSNPKHEIFEFSLFDMTGRLVEASTTASEKIVLDKGKKPAGVYLIRLANSKTGEQAHGKIVIGN